MKVGLACTVCCVNAVDRPSGVRLAELVAALSLATDLGLGQPQEHVLRQTVVARRLATAAGLPDDQQTAVFYVSLLAWVGCISDSHELAAWFGDDQRLRAASYEVDKSRSEEHTSELQSHLNLVCRLLLEKKKKNK